MISSRCIPLKIRSSVYESCVGQLCCMVLRHWALTVKLEDSLKSCDSRMLRYMARVRWQDRISSEEVAKRCGLKMIQDKLRQKRLQWFGHVRRETEGGVLRLVIGDKESRKTKENLERYSEEGFRTNRVEDGERSLQVRPLLKW